MISGRPENPIPPSPEDAGSIQFPSGAEHLRGRIFSAGIEPSGITLEVNQQFWYTQRLWNFAWNAVRTRPHVSAEELRSSLLGYGEPNIEILTDIMDSWDEAYAQSSKPVSSLGELLTHSHSLLREAFPSVAPATNQ